MSDKDVVLEEAAAIADNVARAAVNVATGAMSAPGAALEADAMARGARMAAASIRARKSHGDAKPVYLEIAGHGSGFVRIATPMDAAGAVLAAEDWERAADTIGGRARVVDAAGAVVWGGR